MGAPPFSNKLHNTCELVNTYCVNVYPSLAIWGIDQCVFHKDYRNSGGIFMKSFFWMVTVVCVIAGLFVPVLWMVAIFTGILAIASAPAGQRADGKDRTGGLLGGVWDGAVISATMQNCPHCLSKIPKNAAVCRYCTRTVFEDSADDGPEKVADFENDNELDLRTETSSGDAKFVIGILLIALVVVAAYQLTRFF
jgi:hypothetical protein